MTAGTVAPNLAPLTTGPRRPVLTAAVFLVTLACGVAQLVHRPLYDHVVRDAARIDDGEWYRLITGMFFQDGWTAGLIVNLIWLAVVGTLAERVFGRARWLLLYFGCGLFGQFMSYIWLNPVGAGNSMCSAGLRPTLPTRHGPRLPTPTAPAAPARSVVGRTVLWQLGQSRRSPAARDSRSPAGGSW
ncbi:rhomboid family intramembrane serine protease [Kribbella speibonae]|uniref:Rhomboid family intramembrane serine protease n=1 Tax=Kribbella speibonae TaxID=1572660 RepID=A0ABY2AB70_9ACTN|nr:rhomboid family intramembrane serine protease [Kribbella speibonae]TCC26766.1 rhomboid family intramembrane serine protease [Kribbella speibonae]